MPARFGALPERGIWLSARAISARALKWLGALSDLYRAVHAGVNSTCVGERARGVEYEFEDPAYAQIPTVEAVPVPSAVCAQSNRVGGPVVVGPDNACSDGYGQVWKGELLNARLQTSRNTRLAAAGDIATSGVRAGVANLVCIDGECASTGYRGAPQWWSRMCQRHRRNW